MGHQTQSSDPSAVAKPETDLSDPRCAPPRALVRDLAEKGVVSMQAEWTAFRGGRTNRVWHVRDRGTEHVVKLYASAPSDTPLFRNDPQAEAHVLDLLAGHGLSPRPVYHGAHSAGAVLIYEHQTGLVWRSGTEQVATLLKALHGRPTDANLIALPAAPDGSDALTRQTLAMLAQAPEDLAAPILALQPRWKIPPSEHQSLLHGDPVPDNLVCPPGPTDARPVLIDWQCPALGDPVMDLALFLSPAMQQVGRGTPLSDSERRSFLIAYDDPGVEARLTDLQPFFHWRMAAYCLWKITRDKPDPAYDPALSAEIAALRRLTN